MKASKDGSAVVGLVVKYTPGQRKECVVVATLDDRILWCKSWGTLVTDFLPTAACLQEGLVLIIQRHTSLNLRFNRRRMVPRLILVVCCGVLLGAPFLVPRALGSRGEGAHLW